MKLLAIESSGPTLSVALSENDRVVAETYWHAGLVHSEKLVPGVEWILGRMRWAPQDIDKIAVSTGPGSFTGIRVGLSCARALGQSLNIPLAGIAVLDILAAAVPEGNYTVYPAIDALRGEVYVRGAGGKTELMAVEDLCRALLRKKGRVLVTGNAAIVHGELLKNKLKSRLVAIPETMHFPRAGILALLAGRAKGRSFDAVKPEYIRRSWAEEKSKDKK